MREVKLARKIWALGLFVTLLSINLTYAGAAVNEGPNALPTKERTVKLNEDGSTKTLDISSTKAPTASDTKKASPAKSVKDAVKGCACSCPAPKSGSAAKAGPWWNCMQGCLRSWGVSPVQLAMCAVACAFGVVPICIACIGISVSLALLCSLGCATYADKIELPDDSHVPILVRNLRRNGRNAERRTLTLAVRR